MLDPGPAKSKPHFATPIARSIAAEHSRDEVVFAWTSKDGCYISVKATWCHSIRNTVACDSSRLVRAHVQS